MLTDDGRPLERRVAREAAHWLMRLGSGRASAAEIGACERWRASDAEHERAWQRAQALRRTLGSVPAEVGMATLARRPASPGRRTMVKTLAAAIAAPPAAWLAWTSSAAGQGWAADLSTAVGERRSVLLADGSRLTLNTDTALDAAVSPQTRDIHLYRGEIHVDAPAGQPSLRVRTALGDVRTAHGRFTVRLDAGRCLVAGAHGVLALAPAHGEERVADGARQAWFDTRAVHLEGVPASADPGWLRGMLHAEAMRLDAFAEEIGRYRRGIVRCDPAVAGLRISGAFQLDNTASALRALPALLPVEVRFRTPYWVVIAPAAA